jgi:hypothetical protein
MADPPAYEFVVFSELEDGTVVTKLASCPNCGIIHKVIDICTSEVLNRDEARTLTSLDDVKLSLTPQLCAILEKHDVDISIWEHARWILENQSWGSFVVLENEKVSGGKNVKILSILGPALFRVETKFITNEVA